jgi:hypothetical protein
MMESYTDKKAINLAAQNAAGFFSVADERERSLRAAVAQAGRAEANRLVKAAKSRPDRFPGSTGAFFNRPAPRRQPVPLLLDRAAPDFAPELKKAGTWAVVEKREWAGEQRIRMETRPGATADMPTNEGDRITEMLTQRGARKISESCYFMACQRGGFSTFATLTLSEEARAKLAQRVIVAKYPMSKNGFAKFPVDPARAKQGPLGIKYQTDGETPGYNVSENTPDAAEMRHPESGALFTPCKAVWAWSVQSEASRFFAAASRMYKRGWQYQDSNGDTVKVPGADKCVPKRRTATTGGVGVTWLEAGPYTPIKFEAEPLAYLWVAENPLRGRRDPLQAWQRHETTAPTTAADGAPFTALDDKTGRPFSRVQWIESDYQQDENGELLTNPHIHLLMKWRVDHKHFAAWAARLEKLWGHGTNHLEKIHDPGKAGSYVAKAAGYVSKAQGKTDQGEIRGNRYGISSRARAPAWIETERYQVGLMGWLLAEASEIWNKKHGPKLAKRERLKMKLNGGEIKTKAGKLVKILAETRPVYRKKIGAELDEIRKEIEPLPRASKYGIIFKNDTQKKQFFDWAERRGWTPKPQHSLWLEKWRFQQWRHRNRARLDATAGDLMAWFELADSGAVMCDNQEEGWEGDPVIQQVMGRNTGTQAVH